MSYVELKSRTHYSFLRGASHPHELVDRAFALGLAGLGVTDRNGVYGIPKAHVAAREKPGFKLLTGAELTLEDQPFLSLLAINRQGYGLMCRLISASHRDKPKGEARLTRAEFAVLLTEHPGVEGLIALPDEEIYLEEKHRELLGVLKERFDDRLYLPLHRVLDGHDERRTRKAARASRELGIPIVATNDVHYHIPEKRRLQDVLTAIREILPLEKLGHKAFSNGERYLKSPREMRELFRDLPEALDNTLRVAERCTFSPAELRYYYPSEWVPAGETAQSYLEKETWKGATGRYPDGVPEDVRTQIEYELKLVCELGFADYFLTIWEIVEFARQREILCQGRGSAANSVVCYCLGITAIDPVRMQLLFERFISAERGEPPDIDVDFEHERREEVIQHIYSKYGRERAGMVAAVITYRSRSSRREISKALGLDEETSDPEKIPQLAELMEDIRGFPRHLSIHSGGFTLSALPIIETVPIEPARMEGRTIVQWDKDDLAALGLLKVDVLALGMLSALRKTFEHVNARPDRVAHPRAPRLDLARMPANDPKTYRMIQDADTVGVFQIESRAQMNMLRRLKPENFYDLVVEVAIVRPGPIQGEMVHPYLKRRRGEEATTSHDPRLEKILGKTLGVPLFQEQVMKMAVVMAGFTPGEADELRRAINAWKSKGSLDRMGKRLMEGLISSGLPLDFVERIFKQIQGFSQYGFPESHAASFALLAYASSYLKAHYPVEFACALINSQPMGFYSSHTIVDDLKRHSGVVRAVHPNLSEYDCSLEWDKGEAHPALRVGFRVVHGLAEKDARALLEERGRGLFLNLHDFLSRVKLSNRVLNHLAMGGAFESFGFDQRRALWEILAHRALSRPSTGVQLGLFESQSAVQTASPGDFGALNAYGEIHEDYRSYGLSTRAHPMQALRPELDARLGEWTSARARAAPAKKTIRIAGLIIARQRPQTAKGTVFATLEDETGFLDMIIHPQIEERYGDVFLNEPFVIVTGRIEREKRGDGMSFIADRFEALFLQNDLGDLRTSSHDFR